MSFAPEPLPRDLASRFWAKDATLWGKENAQSAAQFLGWIDIAKKTQILLETIEKVAAEAVADGMTDVVVLGMGGSSLTALVFSEGFASESGIQLHVLDSTVPGDVLRIARDLNLGSTLFVVASKSGTTIEPLALEEYFWERLQSEPGVDAARHMIAITDPGSEMHRRAEQRGYQHTFLGEPSVGGRFSALSVFGMVPAALMGLGVRSMLNTVSDQIGRADHPGFELGQWFADQLAKGRDKLTFVNSPGLESVGLWAEQLIAESTGKSGRGLLPIATEPVGEAPVYGSDRVFFVLSTSDLAEPTLAKVPRGFPVISRCIDSPDDLARLFFELEISTATLCVALGVNAFDQPNVQAAKDVARMELDKIRESGDPVLPTAQVTDGLLFLSGAIGDSVYRAIDDFAGSGGEGLCATILAFLPETAATTEAIQRLRSILRARHRCATAFGYGPRYLHSTGQYHKGGPNNGRFIIITAEDAADAEIPGLGATFGQLKVAQALGDFGALMQNSRAVVHLHIGATDPAPILDRLGEQILSLPRTGA